MTTTEEAKNMRSDINIEGTVERKGEVRTVNKKAGGTIDVCDAYLVDEAGEIKLTLWGDDIPKIEKYLQRRSLRYEGKIWYFRSIILKI